MGDVELEKKDAKTIGNFIKLENKITQIIKDLQAYLCREADLRTKKETNDMLFERARPKARSGYADKQKHYRWMEQGLNVRGIKGLKVRIVAIYDNKIKPPLTFRIWFWTGGEGRNAGAGEFIKNLNVNIDIRILVGGPPKVLPKN